MHYVCLVICARQFDFSDRSLVNLPLTVSVRILTFCLTGSSLFCGRSSGLFVVFFFYQIVQFLCLYQGTEGITVYPHAK